MPRRCSLEPNDTETSGARHERCPALHPPYVEASVTEGNPRVQHDTAGTGLKVNWRHSRHTPQQPQRKPLSGVVSWGAQQTGAPGNTSLAT